MEPLISLAELGVGLACVPDFAVGRQVAEGSLICVLSDFIEYQGAFRAVWPSSKYLSPKLRAFVDFMAKHRFPQTPCPHAIHGAETAVGQSPRIHGRKRPSARCSPRMRS